MVDQILALVSRLPSLETLNLVDPDWGPPCPVTKSANFTLAMAAVFPSERLRGEVGDNADWCQNCEF